MDTKKISFYYIVLIHYIKVHLVKDWKKSLKWFSVQAMLLVGIIQIAWMEIPFDMKSAIPAKLVSYLTIGLLICGIVGRVIKQGETDGKN